ncbi:RmlD substrate binding domain protein [uncultured archaeon]|nr:RmlD substrate binding domain protein [uncultured archaeon]
MKTIQNGGDHLKNKMAKMVFGAGFLGRRIAEQFDYRLVSKEEINPLNLTALQSFLDREKSSIVINAIGKTGRPNIDWCETHKEETLESNVTVPINLSAECSKRGIYFVHIGSGCIYSGFPEHGFTEKDTPNFYGPQFYAKTKIISELALAELPGLILRIRMPIDNRSHDRNLIDKLRKYSCLISEPNSMTTVPHALNIIKSLIERRKQGIYNLVNPGMISASDIMSMYKTIVDPSHNFSLMSLNELDSKTLGKRSNCYLSTAKLASEGLELPEIHNAVEECLTGYRGVK